MLILISPAKTLDFESPVNFSESSEITFRKEAAELMQILRKHKPEELSKLMAISTKLAILNFERFRQWSPAPNKKQERQAVLAYKGNVYDGLQAGQFSETDFHFAQEHLRILSGLYGVLKPLDSIQPYRLEMGTPLITKKGLGLYKFWTAKITKCLKQQLKAEQSGIILNLASLEYMKAIAPGKMKVITPVFQDYHHGRYKIISIYAKHARGAMSRFIIQNKITDIGNICAFQMDGYSYNNKMSTQNHWIFTR